MFKSIIKSVSDHSFYKEIISFGAGGAVKNFIKVSLVISVLGGFLSFIFMVPSVKLVINELTNKVVSYYPDNLIIDIKSGILSTNSETPVSIPLTKPWQSPATGEIKNAILIDVSADESLDSYKDSQSFALITDSHVVYQEDNGQINFMSIAPFGDVSITKEKFSSFVSYSKYIPVLIPFAVFGFLLIRGFFMFIPILLTAMVLFFIFKFLKQQKSYKESFIVTAYASLVPYIVTTIVFPFMSIPFLFTLSTLVVALVMTKEKDVISQNKIVDTNSL